MEIRNQFIHNHKCSSFSKLGETNPELTNYLKKTFSQRHNRGRTLDYVQSSIDNFILSLNLTISETRVEILDELEGEENMTKAFKRKISIDELIKKSSKNEISDKQDKNE